ncbi:hypothetical protein FOZ62_007333 [Perkinsus olseni]|uniref:Uncharacterized protein n=1 Tax=Perkinsus olseni TaxID=32597 RepID=A0A7J6Q0R4_PEROL|nr:hypothetical protein FOZ62_007333 [Perkinsus olseni]
MWTTVVLLSLCTLDSVASSPPPNAHLNFYKEVRTPWYIKEAPNCVTKPKLCPIDPSYTWDYYFDYLLGKGVSSFLLGSYSIWQSKIGRYSPFYTPWDKAGFAALKQQVEAKGGRILANLGAFFENSFDKAAFQGSAHRSSVLLRVSDVWQILSSLELGSPAEAIPFSACVFPVILIVFPQNSAFIRFLVINELPKLLTKLRNTL